MKKILALILIGGVCLGILTGCTQQKEAESENKNETEAEIETAQEDETPGKKYLGMTLTMFGCFLRRMQALWEIRCRIMKTGYFTCSIWRI